MIRLPPRSTLFPYTRSSDLTEGSGRSISSPAQRDSSGAGSPAHWSPMDTRSSRSLGIRRGDRKSTRLNSSHTVISYAVFCLKKKKKYEDTSTENYKRDINTY